MNVDQQQLLFTPRFVAAATGVRAGRRLVHYTSAEAAYRILTGAEVWLRSAHLMNDYSELRHGLTCLQKAWASTAGLKLQSWLEERWPGLRDELQQTFDGHSNGLLDHTYILSLSEHDDDEDQLGRLSMWRAYGGRSGVALVLNTEAFLADTDAMAVFSTPVIYEDVDPYVAWFAMWVDALIEHQDDLAAMARQEMLNVLFLAFRLTVLATKHPGFHEEKEWRVFHSPVLDGSSDWVQLRPEVVNGVPQHVTKLQLRDDQEKNILGVAPASLLSRVIIGPCENPLPIRNALWAAMEDAGVTDVADKIWMSNIPLRQR